MGQPNSPLLSKQGYSMYWSTMWANKFIFTKKASEDIFINMFLPFFFKKTFLNTARVEDRLLELLKKKNKTRLIFNQIFFGKCWLLFFQNWVIIVFYTYNPLTNLKKQVRDASIKYQTEFLKIDSCRVNAKKSSNYFLF